MNEDFRGFLARLESAGVLRRIKREVDPRHFSTLLEQARGPLLFERVKGYDAPAVGNVAGNRRCVTEGLQVGDREIGRKMLAAIERPIPPEIVASGPCQEVVYRGDEADLSMFPIPLISTKDGGPYIGGGIMVTKHPEYGRNVGMYRMMYRTPREMNMGVLTSSDMYFNYTRARQDGRPLEVAVAIGVHLTEQLGASYQAPLDVDEFSVAGGLRGEPVRLVRCQTVDLEVPADAEAVLEGEVLPEGWVYDEGRFGEWTWYLGEVVKMPVFRVKCITTRKQPIFHALHMPWENDWLKGPIVEGTAYRVLRQARIDARAVNATLGGGCAGVIYAAIRKLSPGEGKDALHALLSAIRPLKYAVVVDEDVDVYNPEEIDWALAFRVQADRDAVIINGVRGTLLDPSTRPWELKPGEVATTSKLGIDATIPDRAPKGRFERMTPIFHLEARLEDYL
jgi:2,5-furandicarboxylate decarboxylase 1